MKKAAIAGAALLLAGHLAHAGGGEARDKNAPKPADIIYQIQQEPNLDVRTFHLSIRIVPEDIDSYTYEQQGPPVLVELRRIPGVVDVFLDTYQIQISKARVFDWEELTPKILEAIATAYNGHMVWKPLKAMDPPTPDTQPEP